MTIIRVVSFRDAVEPRGGLLEVNTTSRSTTWSKGLSPFFLGPCRFGLRQSECAQNVENAWQYTKVYPEHVDADGKPTEAYWEWARAGWAQTRAVRYPMGKGAKPLYSLWKGAKLTYVEARKQIYIPLYSKAVVEAPAFYQLLELAKTYDEVVLRDFDGYDHRALNMSFQDVINNPERKMGHAFVLAMLLESLLTEEQAD